MEHEDAEISDIVVVLKQECAEKLDETTNALKQLGMEIEQVDPGNGVVEGTILADKVSVVKKWVCVEYVRVDFTYVADFSTGDPRNQDPPDAREDNED